LVRATSNVREPRSTVPTTREYHLPQANCPSCNDVGLDVAEAEYNVENIGPVLVSVSSCRSCGYKHTDVFSLSTHEPTATTVKAQSSKDMKIRVVRGSTAKGSKEQN
jgi:zinc finger protein